MKIKFKSILVLIIVILIAIAVKEVIAVSSIIKVPSLTIVLDPGHGGSMSGAVNDQLGIVEREITLKTARYLRDFLNQYDGVKVIMTHDGNLPSDYELELPERGMIARRNQADLLVSLHFNAAENGVVLNGAEVYVTANKLLPKYNQQSTQLGNKILNQLSGLGIANRGVKTRLCNDSGPKWEYSDGTKADYYAVIRYPMKGDAEDHGADLAKGEGIPGILIEHCYIRGSDTQFIDSDEDLQRLALADGRAIVEQYGLKLKTDVVQSIFIDKAQGTMVVGDVQKWKATIEPQTAKNKNVIWSSSNESVVFVEQDGTIKAVGKGTAKVKATSQEKGLVAEAIVNVEEPMIEIEEKEISMLQGSSYQIGITIPEGQEITWKSGDDSIVTVNKQGLLEGKKEGETTVKAILSKYAREVTISVNVTQLKENQSIKWKEDSKEENGIIYKLVEKMKVEDLLKRLSISEDLTVKIKSNSDFIGTNTKVEIIEKQTGRVLQDYHCLLYADVNGDGKISAMDYALIKNHIMDVKKINNLFQKQAADVSKDGKISAMDYALIKNHIMDVKKIEQK